MNLPAKKEKFANRQSRFCQPSQSRKPRLERLERRELFAGDSIGGIISGGGVDSTVPVVSVSNVVVSEPLQNGRDFADFTVSLRNFNPEVRYEVRYGTGNGIAKAGHDFEATAGIIEFTPHDRLAPNRQYERVIRVPILPDSVFDPNETFSMHAAVFGVYGIGYQPVAGVGQAIIRNTGSGPSTPVTEFPGPETSGTGAPSGGGGSISFNSVVLQGDTLIIRGSHSADHIQVQQTGDHYEVSFWNDGPFRLDRFETSAVHDVEFVGGPGDDVFENHTNLPSTIHGGDGNDVLQGGGGVDLIFGDSGNDTLRGQAGNDDLRGGSGDDWLIGGQGDDVVRGETGNDWMTGSEGHDRVYGGDGDDEMYADVGDDRLYGEHGNDRIFGQAGENRIYGGDGNDTIHGGSDFDRIYGEAGHDYLYGGEGDDRIYGGDGNDWITGQAGDDQLFGGDGSDTLYGDIGADKMYGDAGHDLLFGQAGNDYLDGGSGNDWLLGGAGNDRLLGRAGDDAIYGGEGADHLYGEIGNDVLYGEHGDDQLDAGDGDDLLDGGQGTNSLKGGAGHDRFRVIYSNHTSNKLVDHDWQSGEWIDWL